MQIWHNSQFTQETAIVIPTFSSLCLSCCQHIQSSIRRQRSKRPPCSWRCSSCPWLSIHHHLGWPGRLRGHGMGAEDFDFEHQWGHDGDITYYEIMINTIMTVMSLMMMTLIKKCNLCRESQSNIGSSAITTDEHPGIRRLRKLRLHFHRLYHRLYKLFIPCNHIDSLDTVIMKLTPWNAKEVEYVDQAHADGVQAGRNVFDAHCYNKTCGNKHIR